MTSNYFRKIFLKTLILFVTISVTSEKTCPTFIRIKLLCSRYKIFINRYIIYKIHLKSKTEILLLNFNF